MRRSLLIVCLLAACRTTSPTPDPAPNPTDPIPDAPPQWLVWTTSDSGPKTHRLGLDDAGRLVVLGSTDGAYIGVPGTERGRLWAFGTDLVASSRVDCECEMQAQTPEEASVCTEPLEVKVGVLRSIPTGPTMELPPRANLGTDTEEVSSGLDGNVGPFVFATVCIQRYGCGAHGDMLCAQHIYDLRTATELEAVDLAPTRLRGEAMLTFVREAYEDEHEAAELAEEDVDLTWVAPEFEHAWIPRMEEQYTGPTCYACSDGLWDSYTLSSRRTVEALPPVLEDWLDATAKPPDEFLKTIETELGGWSVVPNDPAIRQELDALFTDAG